MVTHLQTATTTTTLATSRVAWHRRHVLNATNAHTSASESTKSALATGTRRLGAHTTSGTQADVHGIDADFLAASSAVLSGKHSGVRRRLVAVGLHLHTTRNTDDGFLTSQISDVHKGIVEAGVNAVVVSICSSVFCRGRGRSFLSIHYTPSFQDTYWATPKTIFPSSTLGPSETSWLGAIWSVSANVLLHKDGVVLTLPMYDGQVEDLTQRRPFRAPRPRKSRV